MLRRWILVLTSCIGLTLALTALPAAADSYQPGPTPTLPNAVLSSQSAAVLGAHATNTPAQAPSTLPFTGSDVTGMHYADYVVIRIDSLRREQKARKGGLASVQRSWAWPTVVAGVAIVLVFVVFVVLSSA